MQCLKLKKITKTTQTVFIDQISYTKLCELAEDKRAHFALLKASVQRNNAQSLKIRCHFTKFRYIMSYSFHEAANRRRMTISMNKLPINRYHNKLSLTQEDFADVDL